jgi:hypothetical protein
VAQPPCREATSHRHEDFGGPILQQRVRTLIRYIRVVAGASAIADRQLKLEIVDSLAKATPLTFNDADYFWRQACLRWPEFNWKIDALYKSKYVIRGK